MEINQLVKSYKPDIIYTHTFKAGALVRLMNHGVPIVHAFHGHLLDEPELSSFRKKAVTIIERFLAPRTNYLVTVGNRVARDLLAAGIGGPDQYVCIPPGVPVLKLNNRHDARQRLNLENSDKLVVAWLARVVAVKGPSRVVELAHRFPNVNFILAGGGDLIDELKTAAPKNLKILGWQDAADIWAVSDIAVSTSVNEGMPIALIEAQLSGIPVVSLDAGSVSEVIEHGETGFVLKSFDEKYVDALRVLIEDKELRLKLGERARQRALELFSPSEMILRHEQLFSRIVI